MELTNKGTATIVIFFVAFVAITNIEACNDFKVDRDSYIAGGNEAIPHEFPWMVALEVRKQISHIFKYTKYIDSCLVRITYWCFFWEKRKMFGALMLVRRG